MTAPIIDAAGFPLETDLLQGWAELWAGDVRAFDFSLTHPSEDEARAAYRRRRLHTGQLWDRLAEVTR